jgi:hypothetical protein
MRSLDSNLSRSLSAPPFGSVSFQGMTLVVPKRQRKEIWALQAAEKLPGFAGSAPESRRDGLKIAQHAVLGIHREKDKVPTGTTESTSDVTCLGRPVHAEHRSRIHEVACSSWHTRRSIGVGRTGKFPLPPNRTGGFPAYGSPVGGFTSKRIDTPEHGHDPRKRGPAQRRRHLSSDCCPTHGLALVSHHDSGGYCAGAYGPSNPAY